jgi:hypothetical protein
VAAAKKGLPVAVELFTFRLGGRRAVATPTPEMEETMQWVAGYTVADAHGKHILHLGWTVQFCIVPPREDDLI